MDRNEKRLDTLSLINELTKSDKKEKAIKMGLKIPAKNRDRDDLASRSSERRAKREDVQSKEIMNLEEVANFLGVAPATIKTMIASENFPHRRIGERWLFGRRAVVAWINLEK